MDDLTATDYPQASPLVDTGVEMATCRIKIVIARSGCFTIAGADRTSFVVGSSMAPLAVAYSPDASCMEYALPPWMAMAVLGVSGGELGGAVCDLQELPSSPFRNAALAGEPDALAVAQSAFANWRAGRGTADARLACATWSMLRDQPSRPLASIAADLGVGSRRVRDAVWRQTGVSPAQLRRLIRLDRAIRAIADPHLSLAAAALVAGYADQSHMTREMMGLGAVTPSRYRRALHAI